MKEFLAWLEANKDRLALMSLEEQRNLAIEEGQDPIAVGQWYHGQRFKRAL